MSAGLDLAAAAALLLLTAGVLLARSPTGAVDLYALAALPQAAVVLALAGGGGWPLALADALAILAVKGLVVPGLLRRRLLRGRPAYGLRTTVAPSLLLPAGAALVLLGLRLGALLRPGGGLPLGLCLAGLLLGFAAPLVRSELWAQVAGLLVGEGALTAALVLVAGGLPALAEVFVLGEVVALAAVLAALVRAADTLHGTGDARLLARLRG